MGHVKLLIIAIHFQILRLMVHIVFVVYSYEVIFEVDTKFFAQIMLNINGESAPNRGHSARNFILICSPLVNI